MKHFFKKDCVLNHLFVQNDPVWKGPNPNSQQPEHASKEPWNGKLG
jgi:hypothetical protein